MSNKIYVFLRVVPYFDEPVGRVKIQTMCKAILHNKTSYKRFIIQHAKLLCLRGRISNRSSGVHISRDTTTTNLEMKPTLARHVKVVEINNDGLQSKLRADCFISLTLFTVGQAQQVLRVYKLCLLVHLPTKHFTRCIQ